MNYAVYVSLAGGMCVPLVPMDGRDTDAEARAFFGSEPHKCTGVSHGAGFQPMKMPANGPRFDGWLVGFAY